MDQVEPFITKDGSQIRELLGHRNSAIKIKAWQKQPCLPMAAPMNTIMPKLRKYTISLKVKVACELKLKCKKCE